LEGGEDGGGSWQKKGLAMATTLSEKKKTRKTKGGFMMEIKYKAKA
jgi:hypothetical protein